eukprot:COSAG01_NODE_1929_length_8875_cov_23.472425_7_plen_155_part_00
MPDDGNKLDLIAQLQIWHAKESADLAAAIPPLWRADVLGADSAGQFDGKAPKYKFKVGDEVIYSPSKGQDHPAIIKMIHDDRADILLHSVNMSITKVKLSGLRPSTATGAQAQDTTINVNDDVTYRSPLDRKIYQAKVTAVIKPVFPSVSPAVP